MMRKSIKISTPVAFNNFYLKNIFVHSDSATDDEDGGEADVLDSDEDEIDEAGNQYLETLENRIHKHSNGNIEVGNNLLVRSVQYLILSRHRF